MAQWVSNPILFLALVSATWYAWETRKMRLQMIRPQLVILTRPHKPSHMQDNTPLDLVISNVGDGAALNIIVERTSDQRFKIRFAPEHIPVLQKGERAELVMHPAEGTYQPDMTTVLAHLSVSLKITARYVDVEGRQFRTSTQVGAGAKPPFIQDETEAR